MQSPNVILLVLDTARYDRFGSSGCDRNLTPNMDTLAESGRSFANMITPHNWTMPNHAALFTGLYPCETGTLGMTSKVRSNGVWTMAETLRKNGYSTTALLANRILDPLSGITRGFDRVLMRKHLGLESNQIQKVWRLLGFLDAGAAAIRSRMREFTASAPSPFFIFANMIECHWPYMPIWRYEKLTARSWRPYPLAMWSRLRHALTPGRKKKQWQLFLRATPERLQLYRDRYDAELRYLDSIVGGIVQHLRDAGLWEQTIFIVTSDHGENIGDHGLGGHAFSLHDTLIHVPFIAHMPGARPGRIEGLVQSNDVLPSVIEACGLETGLPDTQRRPYQRLFTMSPEDPGREFAFAQLFDNANVRARLQMHNPRFDFSILAGDMQSARTRRYKWMRRLGHGEWLFDLETDPGEQGNVIDREPDEAARLRAAYERWESETPRYDPEGEGVGFTEEEQRRIEAHLQAIGYL